MLFPETTTQAPISNESYLVFARKYRPQNFQELIGQNHLVDILTNAFDNNRIAHAYILTGVRGVGKTTTARIIAKGLNCQSHDKATINPCGKCQNCTSITAGKNIDVFEMDAASRTGIDDIREIIDSIPYKPLSCRYKVYIIDEVHMLSKAAFNGLLKTLEEPPSHVKFIFATTEIHKILPTILSRCQRIDLKRVDIQTLTAFFAKILVAENVLFDDVALAKIARSSDGSVRDGLSLLDQAVVAGAGHVTTQIVSDMLGVAEGDEILNIITQCLDYKPQEALSLFHQLYETGFDCYLFVKELLRTTEWLIRLKFSPEIAKDISLNENFVEKSINIANKAEIHLLSRMWEISLKATQDIKIAPDAKAVCEIAIIRMNYGLSLPDPSMMYQKVLASEATTEEKKNTNSLLIPKAEIPQPATITNLQELLKLLSRNRLLDIVSLLEVKLIVQEFRQGYIRLTNAPTYKITTKDIQFLKITLDKLTHSNWEIKFEELNNDNNHVKSLYEQKKEYKNQRIEDAYNDKNVKAVLSHFPNAKLLDVIDAIPLPKAQDLIDSINNNDETED